MKLSNKISNYYGEVPFELTEGQKNFLEGFTTSEGHYSLAGIQGSGKTTIMELLAKFYGDEIIFCATSGVASQQLPNNLGSGTAHRILGLPIEVSDGIKVSKVPKACQELLGTSDLIKVIVIDEAYCANSHLLWVALQRIKRFNKATTKRKVRSIRLLLVGDPLQRLPICSDQDKDIMKKRYGHYLMFKSNVWREAEISTYILDEVKRTNDKIFKACQDVIRYGIESRYEKTLAWLNTRVSQDYDKSLLLLAPTRSTVKRANTLALDKNPNPTYRFPATPWGKFNMREAGIEPFVDFCLGQEIITLINHAEGDFVNGDFGTIVDICTEGTGIYMKKKSGEDVVFVEVHEFFEEEVYVEIDVPQEEGGFADELRKKKVGGCKALPIMGSSGMTIARSQGRTFTTPIVIDMEGTGLYTRKGDFGTADLLVGLSRATSIDNITLATPIKKEHIKVCRESIAYWNETLAKQKQEEL
jgi:hypothetical protein